MYLTTDEAMELLRVSRTTIDNYVNKGVITAYKPMGRRLFKRDEIIRFVENNAVYSKIHPAIAASNKKGKKKQPNRSPQTPREWREFLHG